MTEAEWLVCEDVREMLEHLRAEGNTMRRQSGRRRLRLFGCASFRDCWELLPDPRSRKAIEVSEAIADGKVYKSHAAIRRDAYNAFRDRSRGLDPNASEAENHLYLEQQALAQSVTLLLHDQLQEVIFADPALNANRNSGGHPPTRRRLARLRVLAGYLRDIFGNPFRPIAFRSSWRTEHTVGLALKMYEDREFAAMPILADALEEAGCDNADILSHCREPGVHVRGCWVVDLVLNKA